jgi:hypothetical protein
MKRALVLAAGLVLATSAARAQVCLSLSDGFGATTVSCPDGRAGLLRTDPAGGVTGLIGGQPYAGTTAGVDPTGPPSGVPSTSYLIAPPPPSFAAPAPDPPAEAPTLGPLTPTPELTPLQQEYQAEQASLRARRLAAEQAAKAKPAKP